MPIVPYSVKRTSSQARDVAALAAAVDRNLDAIERTLQSLTAAGVVTNEVVKTVKITASTLVFHSLGRLAHWEVINQDGAGGLHEGALPAGVSGLQAIYFVPDGAGGNYTIRFT